MGLEAGSRGRTLTNGKQSRYFETAARMDEAFLDLLGEKDFELITVKEICQRAGISRSAFYLHYETLGDLLDECCEWMVARFLTYMPKEAAEFTDGIEGRTLEELYLLTPRYLVPYLRFVAENRRLFTTVLRRGGALPLVKLYGNTRDHVLEPALDRYGVPEHDRDYFLAFTIRGCVAVVEEWLRRDCADPIDHVVEVMQACCRTPQG